MVIHTTRLINLPLRALLAFQYRYMFHSVYHLSSPNQTIPETVEDTTSHVSTLINQPNWEQNNLLKSLASHMTPHVASKVIELHSNNIDLGFRFFKWVCKHSTYCFDLDSRIHLLKLMVSSSLFVVAHKAIIVLNKECSNCETEILRLIGALENMREVGFRLNYPCYSTLLMSLAKLNMGFVAFLVYRRMEDDGFVLGGIDYKTIINALCKNGFVQAAEMFFCRVLRLGFGLDTHIYTSLLLGNCKVIDLQEAFRVFEIMSEEEGCRPNSVTYSILIHGLCEAGRLQEALHLKQEMNEKGCQPSTRTYTVLIKAMCDIRLIEKAQSFLDEMIMKGFKPNVHTYTILIDNLCREGKMEEANGMFKTMLKDGLFPGTITYNALINGYCKEGRVVSAFELLSVMERRNCKPTIRTYNELIEGLCRVNRPSKAMLLLRRAVGNGLLPNRVTYNILIEGFCREGELNVAFKIFYTMNTLGLKPDGFTFTSLIDGLCKHGRPEEASGVLGSMVKKGISPDEVTFTALIDGYCKIGEPGNAFMLFERMVEDRCLTTYAINSFLDVLSKEKKVNEENAMFGKMLKYGVAPSVVTYTILIDGLCRAGETANFLNLLKLMKQDGCSPNVYTYTAVINGLCQMGRVEEAEMLLFSMSELGVSPNHITYTVLVKAHVNAGRLDRALKTVSIMLKNGCQPNAGIYYALLAGFVFSSKAIEAGAGSSTGDLDARSLPLEENGDDSISNHIFREMDVEHAFELQDKIEKCGGSTTELYNFVVVGLCKEGRIAEADYLIRGILKSGLFPDKAICAIIELYCKECKYDYCLNFIDLILQNGFIPSFASYCALIHGLSDEGKVQQAHCLVSDLLRYNGIEEKTAISPHIEFLVKRDEPDKCLELLKLIEQVHNRERPII